MNLQEYPDEVKKDIEDQSLSILENINDDIIVIGGWGVRAHLGDNHGRYTLDIDGVADIKKNIDDIENKLTRVGLNVEKKDWGIKFFQKYKPDVKIPHEIIDEIKKIELRIEISGPQITESETEHFFEFSLTDYEVKEIQYYSRDEMVKVKVPSIEFMAANKLGLPVDYKNNFDAQMLLNSCDVEKVIKIIKSNDNWGEMVIRRMPKIVGRLNDKTGLVYSLLISKGIDIKKQTKILDYIKKGLNN